MDHGFVLKRYRESKSPPADSRMAGKPREALPRKRQSSLLSKRTVRWLVVVVFVVLAVWFVRWAGVFNSASLTSWGSMPTTGLVCSGRYWNDQNCSQR